MVAPAVVALGSTRRMRDWSVETIRSSPAPVSATPWSVERRAAFAGPPSPKLWLKPIHALHAPAEAALRIRLRDEDLPLRVEAEPARVLEAREDEQRLRRVEVRREAAAADRRDGQRPGVDREEPAVGDPLDEEDRRAG